MLKTCKPCQTITEILNRKILILIFFFVYLIMTNQFVMPHRWGNWNYWLYQQLQCICVTYITKVVSLMRSSNAQYDRMKKKMIELWICIIWKRDRTKASIKGFIDEYYGGKDFIVSNNNNNVLMIGMETVSLTYQSKTFNTCLIGPSLYVRTGKVVVLLK